MKKFYYLLILFCPITLLAQIPKMASRPAATTVVFLDFDGHIVENTSWNDVEEVIDALPAPLSPEDILAIYRIVREDFIPFNINITTDSMYYEQASVYSRHRVIITPTSYWTSGDVGVAVIGCLAFGDETPSFVFADQLFFDYFRISQVVSHEIGHALGLHHITQWNSNCTVNAEYKGTTGTEFPTFAPIMGESFNADISGWVNDFSELGCTELQNEIDAFHSGRFGFIAAPDDISDFFAYAKPFSPYSAHVTDGVIGDSADVDIFKLTLAEKRIIDIDVTPNRVHKQTRTGINFIPEVDLYNADSVLLRTYRDPYGIDVFIDTVLNPGTYYFKVRAVGGENLPYYSSFGSYEFLYLVRDVVLNDWSVTLSGNQKGSFHELQWDTRNVQDEVLMLQYSLDGVNFSSIYKDSLHHYNYSWKPQQFGIYFYRVAIIDRDGKIKGYSEILTLNNKNNLYKLLYTAIQNQIELLMLESGEYELIDVNGRVIQKGKLSIGMQKIILKKKAKGMLFLRIYQKNVQNTEKLIVL